jgi:gentisate 1,2-dioxygenase
MFGAAWEAAMTLSSDTKERLASVKAGLESNHLVDFAVVQAELEIPEPRPAAVPHLWKWEDVKPWLSRTYAGMSLEEVHRRTLAFKNPGMKGRPFAASSLFMSISMYFPGDEAGVHRHMASASRFLLEGTGGFTTVGGEKCVLERGDLVITPNGQWHDHGNEGSEPIVWVNVLDIPMTEFFNAVMTEWDYREIDPASNSGEPVRKKMQSLTSPVGYSRQLFGSGGIVPRFGPERRGDGAHSPMFLYKWRDTEATLMALRNEDGSPYDGILVEYVDPVSGGPVVPTLSFSAQLLRPAEVTKLHRHTSSAIYCVLKGEGFSEIDGKRFAWKENDLFVVPGWMWHRHANLRTGADAVLYSVSDAPALKKLGFYREQASRGADPPAEVAPWPRFYPERRA